MYATDLADLAKSKGLSVTETSGWKSRGHGPLSSVSAVIIHHTAGAATGDYPSLGVVTYGRSDLAGPLCNAGVGRSGRIYTVAAGYAYHAGAVLQSWQGNTHSIGIECESVGTGTPWPAAQVVAAAKFSAAICKKYGLSASKVLGHNEVCAPVGRKVDPIGIPGGMSAFRALVSEYMNDNEEDDVSAVDVWGYKNEAAGDPVDMHAAVMEVYKLLKALPDATLRGWAYKNGTEPDMHAQLNDVYARVDKVEEKVDAILAHLQAQA